MFGAPWPFPENVCDECTRDLFKDPEFLARWDPFMKGVKARNAKEWAQTKRDLREAVLKVLNFADNLAGKL